MILAELTALAPALDEPTYFAVQQAPGAPKIASLNVSQPEFIKAVQAELTSEPLEDLRAYLRFHVATAEGSTLVAPIAQADFAFFSTTLRCVPAMPPRWKTCPRQVDRYLGEAFGQEFVRRTFSIDMKARTQLMRVQIETAMGQEIAALDWMSPETARKAQRKLHAIRNKIGYPETGRDYRGADH